MTDTRLIGDDPDAIDAQFEDVSDVQADLDMELNSIFSEFGGDDTIDEYEIRVYRVQPGKGSLGYLFACLPSELPILDKLRDQYGGGDFEIRVLKNKKIFKRRKCVIEEPKNKPAPTANTTSEILMVVQTMNNGFTKLGELIASQQNAGQNISPMAMQSEMLQNMVAMKDFLGGNEKPQESPLAVFKQMVEIQKTIGGVEGGGGFSDSLLSIANQVLPKLADMGQQEQAFKAQRLRGTRKPRLKRPAATGQRRQPSENPMKLHLIFLCAQAKLNNDPRLYAQMVLDNTAENKRGELIEFIGGPNALTEMAKVHKGVLKYPSWFGQLGEYIIVLSGESRSESGPTTQTGSVNNSNIPGAVGSETIATVQTKANADQNAIISDS